MASQQYSYKNHPIIYKVTLCGNDISEFVKGIDSIESSLDYPDLNEFRISEATITLRSPTESDSLPVDDFNPYKSNNYYEREGDSEEPAITSSGYRAPVSIIAGFQVAGVSENETLRVIYNGQILNITKDAKNGDVTILCSDQSQSLRDDDIIDFGIQRNMKVEASGGSLHGNYPFFSGLNEPSLESISGTSGDATPGTDPPDNILQRKNVLRTEGDLDEFNFRELASGIETEGGPLPDNADPILQFKSPYRNRTVESIVAKLLQHYGIGRANQEIKVPIISNTDNKKYFSNLGRPTYETNLTDTANTNPGIWQWPGTVTDMLVDTTNNNLYLLISQTGSTIKISEAFQDPNPKPRIIRWDLDTDDKKLIREVAEGAADVLEECWRFVANNNFTTFYVLGTSPTYENAKPRDLGTTTRPGFEFGSYDSSEGISGNTMLSSKVLIHKVERTSFDSQTGDETWGRETYVNSNVANPGADLELWPQLAMHYHLGFARTDSDSQNRYPNRQGNLPDSRRNLYLDSCGNLYYPFANRDHFGIAKASGINAATRVIQANRDDDGFNLAGFDFWIDEDNDHAFLAYTHINNRTAANDSRFRIVRIGI